MFLLTLLTLTNAEIISPIFGESAYKKRVLNEIYNSNISIMATIYKFDDDDIFDAFMDIGNRGVEMKIICDSTAYDRCSKLSNFGMVQQFNIKGYDKLHAKSLLIDGRALIIGSFNLDQHGFSTNMEIGLITNNDTVIGEYVNFINTLMNN